MFATKESKASLALLPLMTSTFVSTIHKQALRDKRDKKSSLPAFFKNTMEVPFRLIRISMKEISPITSSSIVMVSAIQ